MKAISKMENENKGMVIGLVAGFLLAAILSGITCATLHDFQKPQPKEKLTQEKIDQLPDKEKEKIQRILAEEKDTVKTIRGMIQHENTLRNNRFTWMITFQTLLFAALAFAWDKTGGKKLATVFCFFGIVVSGFSYVGLAATTSVVYYLWKWWYDYCQVYNVPLLGLDKFMDRPELRYFFSPWNFITLTFLMGWCAICGLNWARPTVSCQKTEN